MKSGAIGMPVLYNGCADEIVASEEHFQIHNYTEKTEIGEKILLIPVHLMGKIKVILWDVDGTLLNFLAAEKAEKGGNNAGIVTCWYNPERKENDMQLQIDYEITDLGQVLDII